jgi:hypothetical protein
MKVQAILTQQMNKNTNRREWALVSHKHHRVLKWFGPTKPSHEEFLKAERTVQYWKHHASYSTLARVLSQTDPYLYHISPVKFTQFKQAGARGREGVDIGFHFGTEETAMSRANHLYHEGKVKVGEPLYLYKVKLQTTKPLDLPENRLGSFQASDFLQEIFKLAEEGKIPSVTPEMIDDYYEDKIMLDGENWKDDLFYESPEVTVQKMNQFLNSIGYDSISYDNQYEGGGKSYVVFDPSKIEIQDVKEFKMAEPTVSIVDRVLADAPLPDLKPEEFWDRNFERTQKRPAKRLGIELKTYLEFHRKEHPKGTYVTPADLVKMLPMTSREAEQLGLILQYLIARKAIEKTKTPEKYRII